MNGITSAEGTATFTYDDTGQLTGVDRPAGQADETYGYDLNGNPNTAGSATDAGNRVAASPGFTYTYDFAGNLATKTETATGRVTSYAYDHRNRLTGVTIADSAGAVVGRAAYTSDALDRRIRVQTDADGDGAAAPATTWTAYDGEHAYADFDAAGALLTRYLHGPAVDMLLARTTAAGASAWYLTDRLGSVRDVADTAGVPIYHTGYDGFGARTGATGPGGDRWGFTGREHDAVTDQRYHRARYFDAALDRWTQDDPIGFDAGDPNLSRYVGNSPTNATDPSGMAPPASGGYWGGWFNPANLRRGIYTGNPNAPDELYDAVLDDSGGAGESYSHNAVYAHQALDGIGNVPVAGSLAHGTNAVLYGLEGNDEQAARSTLGGVASLAGPAAACVNRGKTSYHAARTALAIQSGLDAHDAATSARGAYDAYNRGAQPS